jgi:hypothetical protein
MPQTNSCVLIVYQEVQVQVDHFLALNVLQACMVLLETRVSNVPQTSSAILALQLAENVLWVAMP